MGLLLLALALVAKPELVAPSGWSEWRPYGEARKASILRALAND